MVSFLLVVIENLLVVFSSFVSGMTGLGQAIIFQSGWSVLGSLGIDGAGSLREGVAITFLSGLSSSIIIGRDTLRAGDVRWDYVIGLAPGSLIFQFLGAAALSSLNQVTLRRVLGIILVVFACSQLWKICKAKYKEKQAQNFDILTDYETEKQRAEKAQSALARSVSTPSTELPTIYDLHSHERDPIPISPSSIFLTPQPIAEHESEWPTGEGLEHTHIHEQHPRTMSVDRAVQTSPAPDQTDTYAAVPTASPNSPNIALIEVVSSGSGIPPSNSLPSSPPELASAPSASDSAPVQGELDITSEPILPHSSSTFTFSPALWWSTFLRLCKQREFQAALLAGSASGFLGGAFGTSGPPVMAFFSMISITKGQVRGTFAWLMLITLIPRLISYIVFDTFHSDEWLMYLLVTPFTLLGTSLGTWAHHQVDVNAVMIMLQGLVLLSTVSLSDAFDGSAYGTIMLVVYAAILILLTGFFLVLYSMTYRFLSSHPDCVPTYVAQTEEKKQRQLDQEQAQRLGQVYEPRERQRNPDGSPTPYTTWHL